MSTHFSQDYLEFFKELAANNHKDWFDINRKRYETEIKKPFENFTQDAIDALAKVNPDLGSLDYKKCIFRINRDVRFSKDKTPYKLNRSAAISAGGKKDMTSPGLYFQLGPENVRFYTGVYSPAKPELMKVRKHIAGNLKKFDSILNDKKFKSIWGEPNGEKNKIIDKSLKEAAEKQPLLYNKGLYFYVDYPAEKVNDPNLIKDMVKAYKALTDFRLFMEEALG